MAALGAQCSMEGCHDSSSAARRDLKKWQQQQQQQSPWQQQQQQSPWQQQQPTRQQYIRVSSGSIGAQCSMEGCHESSSAAHSDLNKWQQQQEAMQGLVCAAYAASIFTHCSSAVAAATAAEMPIASVEP
jgi:hypothetical protein